MGPNPFVATNFIVIWGMGMHRVFGSFANCNQTGAVPVFSSSDIQTTSTWFGAGKVNTLAESLWERNFYVPPMLFISMKMTTIGCKNCGRIVEKPTKEVNRQRKRGRDAFYCCRSCASVDTKTKNSAISRMCVECGREFISTTHKKHRTCCSIFCAKRFAHKHVDTDALSEKMKRLAIEGKIKPPRWGRVPMEMVGRHCRVCGETFLIKPYQKKKTCGESCYRKLVSQNSRNHPNCGGETNYQRYYYNGIMMDSTWEVELAKWMDENGIKWERDRKKHLLWWLDGDGKRRRYYPDFYLPDQNVYLDPKNKYLQGKDKEKIDTAMRQNGVTVLVGFVDVIKKQILN